MASAKLHPIAFLPLGAIIQSFKLGKRDIVLGFPTEALYRSHNTPYFGETIGRICNRLSEGKARNLNGRDYDFVKNEGGITTLHGGIEGWGKKVWEGPTATKRGSKDVTQFVLRSQDGEEGFPGEVEARIFYGVQKLEGGKGRGVEEVVLDIEYEVEMVGNEPDITETVVAMTNHGYFNIGDSPTIEGTEITFATDLHLSVDENLIPTGAIDPLPGLEVQKTLLFTKDAPAVDHCLVLDTEIANIPIDTRSRPLRTAVSLHHPGTCTHLVVETTEPSFQFYTGDGIDVPEIEAAEVGGKTVPRRGARSGIAIEPNRFVDAVNREEWRHMVLLKRGGLWGSRSRFTAWTE